ncbi:hypothetical protein R6Z07F_003740 [Ovis aries]
MVWWYSVSLEPEFVKECARRHNRWLPQKRPFRAVSLSNASRASRTTDTRLKKSVTTSSTALDEVASGNGQGVTGALKTRRQGQPLHFRLDRGHVPRPSPADAAPLASASVPASLPPEVGRLSLSGYGSPSGAGGRTG